MKKYLVTVKMRLLIEAENTSEANQKALDADLSKATIKKGVSWQGTERLFIGTQAFDQLTHRCIMADKTPIKWKKIK